MAHALAGDAARGSWSSSAATSCRRKTRTGIPRRSGSTCATARPSAGSTSSGEEFRPYTHYSVGGNTKFWGSVLYRLRREDFQARRARRRRLARLADRLRHARAVLRPRRAAVPRARRRPATIRPSRRAGRFRIAPSRTPPGMAAIVERLRAPGPASLAAAARPDRPGEPGGCVLCNTCNSFPCRIHAKSDAEVCGVEPALAHAERHALDERAARARLVTDAVGHDGRGRGSRARRRDRRASTRRSSSCRAAPSTRRRCCCARPATRIPTASRTRRAWSAAATWRTWRR